MKEFTRSLGFNELQEKNTSLIPAQYLTATDGIKLAYYLYEPESTPAAALLFIHGGGAYSGAGYQVLAKVLQQKYRLSVCLMDLRGHGNSAGPRGDTPSIEQVWQDLELLVQFLKEKYPGIPLYLGGHSSGAGVLLNYISWPQHTEADGYIFLSPQLGPRSGTSRENNTGNFISVRRWVFLLSTFTKRRFGEHLPAVRFKYPKAVLAARPLLLRSITRNMALAITPARPAEQFRSIDRPFDLIVGEDDELFDPEKVCAYFNYAPEKIKAVSVCKTIPKEKHLSIILKSGQTIGESIQRFLSR
jgi:acylglycerol lipase